MITMFHSSGLRAPTYDCPRLSNFLTHASFQLTSERVALGYIIEILSDRSPAALLLVLVHLTALPIPLPGLSVTFGAPMVLVAGQSTFGLRGAWLPHTSAHRSIEKSVFLNVIAQILPMLKKWKCLSRPVTNGLPLIVSLCQWFLFGIFGHCPHLAHSAGTRRAGCNHIHFCA